MGVVPLVSGRHKKAKPLREWRVLIKGGGKEDRLAEPTRPQRPCGRRNYDLHRRGLHRSMMGMRPEVEVLAILQGVGTIHSFILRAVGRH
jgi:hypothetical protein